MICEIYSIFSKPAGMRVFSQLIFRTAAAYLGLMNHLCKRMPTFQHSIFFFFSTVHRMLWGGATDEIHTEQYCTEERERERERERETQEVIDIWLNNNNLLPTMRKNIKTQTVAELLQLPGSSMRSKCRIIFVHNMLCSNLPGML